LELNLNENVLLFFWTSWCGPCFEDGYLVEFQETTNIVYKKINVSDNPDMAKQFSVVVLPTYVYLKNNEQKFKLLGIQTKQSLLNAFNSC